MKTRDLLEETYSAVTVNKVRSGLTMLGIVIGIASVIALVAVGQGTQSYDPVEHPVAWVRILLMIHPGAQRVRSVRRFVPVAGARRRLRRTTRRRSPGLRMLRRSRRRSAAGIRWSIKGQNTNTSVLGTTLGISVRYAMSQLDIGTFITRYRR